MAQNDLLCTLTLTRVSSNLAYAYVQCSGLPVREAYQKFKQPELSDDFYDYIRQLNILNSPVMLYWPSGCQPSPMSFWICSGSNQRNKWGR